MKTAITLVILYVMALLGSLCLHEYLLTHKVFQLVSAIYIFALLLNVIIRLAIYEVGEKK